MWWWIGLGILLYLPFVWHGWSVDFKFGDSRIYFEIYGVKELFNK